MLLLYDQNFQAENPVLYTGLLLQEVCMQPMHYVSYQTLSYQLTTLIIVMHFLSVVLKTLFKIKATFSRFFSFCVLHIFLE